MSSERKLIRQEVYWAEISHCTLGKILVPDHPDRVWTLQHERDPLKRPATPIIPVHFKNAFLEDQIHDWNWSNVRGGTLRYYSRVTSGKNWILVEYLELRSLVGKSLKKINKRCKKFMEKLED